MLTNRKFLAAGLAIVSLVILLNVLYTNYKDSVKLRPEAAARFIDYSSVTPVLENTDTIKSRKPAKIVKWTHPLCNCTRDIQLYSPPANNSQLKSTCGPVADIRGPHQRVVSFVFYGPVTSDYFKGIARNAKAISYLYPGWVMRLYHDIRPSFQKEYLCETICAYPFFDDCFVGDLTSRVGHNLLDKFGMLWRFVPLGDPLVDLVNVRDVDSIVYQREVDAVNEWLKSNKTWHVLRDHPGHEKDMLGGGWGVKNSDDLRKTADILDKMLKHKGKKSYGYDEWLLSKYTFPEAKKSLLTHDSFHCKERENAQPFPTQRVNRTFVIDHVERNPGLYINQECPVECRPSNHKDWLYC